MIVKITGGLGNQMFQYAFYEALKYHYNKFNVKMDIGFFSNQNVHNGYELEKVFEIHGHYFNGKNIRLSKIYKLKALIYYKLGITKIVYKNYFSEILIGYFPEVFNFKNELMYFDGYWQSEEYFSDIYDIIIKKFSFKDFTEPKNIKLLKIINCTNSVSLHVRRGDFLNTTKFISLGETDYYNKAISYIMDNISNPVFIIFSDDIKWCKKNIDIPTKKIFVNWNHNENSYRDMQLMSLCKYNIIANSSFSWWGAWLNKNVDKIVVAPSKFYTGNRRDESHLIPKKWVKIDLARRI